MKTLKTIVIIAFVCFSNSVSAQSNRILNNYNGSVYTIPNKDLLLYGMAQKQQKYNGRVDELINMLNTIGDFYKLKTEKYQGNIPNDVSEYYNWVCNQLVQCAKYDLTDDAFWLNIKNFYTKHKNNIMSW